MTKQEAVNEVLDQFDSHKVSDVMEYMDCTWWNLSFVTPYDLNQKARKLLEEAYDYTLTTGRYGHATSGGLHAVATKDKGDIILNLSFRIEDVSTYDKY